MSYGVWIELMNKKGNWEVKTALITVYKEPLSFFTENAINAYFSVFFEHWTSVVGKVSPRKNLP